MSFDFAQDERVLAVIPARRDSRGVPGKNMRPLLGKPLVQWSIEAAQAASEVGRVVVSSDWDAVLDIAHAMGADAIKRPPELATDTATTESVIDHVLERVPADVVVLLQPTSPLRSGWEIDEAVRLLRDAPFDAVLSGVRFDRFLWWQRGPATDGWGRVHPREVGPLNYTLLYKRPRRQDIQYPHFLENGSIYVFRAEGYRRTEPRNRLFGKVGVYEMGYRTATEIDTEDDWALVEWTARQQMEARCG